MNTYRRYPSQIVKPVVVAPAGIDCHIVNPTGWTLLSSLVSFLFFFFSQKHFGGLLLVLHDIPLLVSLRVVCKEVQLTVGRIKDHFDRTVSVWR